ncbi:MAG: aminoacetone oxidase family FAD-binding enzyme [Acholeplasma sp.]|nr:aminoacetone oxidase family FAD-binding enzyme [Acholeplasma sp.]
MYNIVIIGGGPSGMMAAIAAKKFHNNKNVILLEKNNELGRKLQLTGGGRCNVTANVNVNEIINNTYINNKFVYSSLSNFGPQEIIDFFNQRGCLLKEEDHNRMLPVSNKAIDIVKTLEREMNDLGVIIRFESIVTTIDDNYVYLENERISYEGLVIATGGNILPASGSSGDGYLFAKHFGHDVTDLKIGLVPLVSNDKVIQDKTLQGLSFKDVDLSIYRNNKVIKKLSHDLLITHFGLSGPLALRTSFFVTKELETSDSVLISLDFLPEYTTEYLIENDDIQGIFKAKEIPQRLVKYLESITKTKKELIEKMKKFTLNIYTTRGPNSALVTNGGVNIKMIDPKTLHSKINDKISFCGEVLDISAYSGGFNITIALATGYTAGKYR